MVSLHCTLASYNDEGKSLKCSHTYIPKYTTQCGVLLPHTMVTLWWWWYITKSNITKWHLFMKNWLYIKIFEIALIEIICFVYTKYLCTKTNKIHMYLSIYIPNYISMYNNMSHRTPKLALNCINIIFFEKCIYLVVN